MEIRKRGYGEGDAEDAGIGPREYVTQFYPEAYCAADTFAGLTRYYIVGVFMPSWSVKKFDTINEAWEYACATLDKVMLRKLAR